VENRFEVVIVGMGPAGMSAAIELCKFGISPCILDENPAPGGQIYRQLADAFSTQNRAFMGIKQQKGKKLVAEFLGLRDKIQIMNQTQVWGSFENNTLALNRDGQNALVNFERLILAEGAQERSIPFPGWTLPGIMTLGGMQKMVLYDRLLPGRRFLVAGCSPLILPTASALLEAGAEIVGISATNGIMDAFKLMFPAFRQQGLVKEIISYAKPVWKARIPRLTATIVVKAAGQNKLEEVTLAKVDAGGKPITGSEKTYSVDSLAISYGFSPGNRLARLLGTEQEYNPHQACFVPVIDDNMQTTIPGVYVAGDGTGIGGADMAEVQGKIAAIHIAGQMGKLGADQVQGKLSPLMAARRRILGYASTLNRVFAPKPGFYEVMDDETIVCRCEQVPLGEIKKGITDYELKDMREIKRMRCGMGLCQGRTCESTITQIMVQQGVPMEEIGYMNLRPPLNPLSFGLFDNWDDSIKTRITEADMPEDIA